MSTSYPGVTVPEGMRWSYQMRINGSERVEHIWTLANEAGGIHVSAWRSSLDSGHGEWVGGIEMHSPKKLYETGKDGPDHAHCWLLGVPCWHDGSSLQFREQIAPMLPTQGEQMSGHDHLAVLSIMMHRHKIWLQQDDDDGDPA